MYIEAVCKGCQAKYQVPVKLSGRVVQCKKCAAKFMVPYKAGPKVADFAPQLIEDEEPVRPRRNTQRLRADEAPVDSAPDRESTFVNDLLELQRIEQEEEERRKAKFGAEQAPTLQGLSPLVTDLWAPLLLAIAGYGLSLYIAIAHVLDSHGRTAGLILIGVVAMLYLVLVLPLTMKMVESAARTLNFGLSNAAWLQTIALFAIPTAAMTIGFFNGHWAGLAAGLIIGLTLAMPAAMLLYRINILTAVQAVVLGAMLYVVGIAGDIAVMIGVASLILPMWNLTPPWGEAPVEVATTDTNETTPQPAAPATAPVLAVRTEPEPAPVVQKPVEVVETPVEADPEWIPLIDAIPDPLRWPASVHHLIPVKPPVAAIHPVTLSPFVALIDADGCDVYDLRTGKANGGVRASLRAAGAHLSPDGELLAVTRPPQAIDIWSTSQGKPIGKIEPLPGAMLPKPLAFVAENRLLTSGTVAGKQVYQVWDAGMGQLLRTIEATQETHVAVSPGGRLLVTLRPGKLTAIDLEEGLISGESEFDFIFFTVHGLDISPDGTTLAAVVAENGPPRLLVFNLSDGSLQYNHSIASAGTSASPRRMSGKGVLWMADSAGVIFDGQMIDAQTGRQIYQLELSPIAGVEGIPVNAASILGALYEYPPTGTNDRMIYKTADAPRGDLLASLRSIRGDAWQPPAEPEPQVIAVAKPIDAPTPKAAPEFNIAELVRKGEWELKVTSVGRTDPEVIGAQMKLEAAKLPEMERAYQKAASELERVSAYEYYYTSDNVRKRRRKYPADVIEEARAARFRADREVDKQKQLVKRLEREQQDAINTRTVAGELLGMQNPPQVLLNVEGEHLLATVDAFKSGQQIRVAGVGRFADNTLTVTPRIIVPLD